VKLYTRTGDDGTTGLFGGQRVGKDDPRVEAYGTVDELNAAIGMVLAAVPGPMKPDLTKSHPGGEARRRSGSSSSSALDSMRAMLTSLQSRLFDLGADLATPAGSKHESKVARLDASHAAELERWIDEVDGGNEPMTQFVLPGGTELAARLHVARTICRRAERLLVSLARAETVNPHAVVVLNRLSDLLFAMARRANREVGVADVPWVPQPPRRNP
jgi:cob(I)alamin adenosyltransferase